MLTGKARTEYMREYMRRRRAGAPKPAARPAEAPADRAALAAKDAEIAQLKAQLAAEPSTTDAGEVAALRQELAAAKALLDAAATKNFTEKGALRIEDAIRIHKERLSKSYWRQVNEEVIRRIAVADDAARKHANELRSENLRLSQMLNQRGVFTERQFSWLLMCVHPDNTASVEIRNEMLQLLVASKRRLIKEEEVMARRKGSR